MHKNRVTIGACALMLLGAKQSVALQTYPLVDHQLTTLSISREHQTRIAVLGDRIQQIFGADGTFDVQSDEEGGQIFLKITGNSQKPITITIITESGLTQDLKLIPEDLDAQSVLFKQELDKKAVRPSTERMIDVIRALKREGGLPGMIKSSLIDNRRAPHNTAIKPLFLYKLDDLEGRVFDLVNVSKETVVLRHETLSQVGDVAVHIESNILTPNDSTKVYILSNTRRSS